MSDTEDHDDQGNSEEQKKTVIIEDYDIAAAEAKALPKFDLNVALTLLASDSQDLLQQIEKDEAELTAMRQLVVQQARRNFVLERELVEIDEKIKLLVRNRISVQEVMSSTNVDHEGATQNITPLQGKRNLYEDLFYILQAKPVYFARLCCLVNQSQTPSFVQTVVFDMYGDQYDTREERLLLHMFHMILKHEIQSSSSRGSLLRANTPITHMLSAYAKRGQGLSILKEILEEPLKEIANRKDLNLEVDPAKIYTQMISDYETKTGQSSSFNKAADLPEILANSEVKAILQQRVKDLEYYVDLILKRVMNAVNNIPYGMRWICKQLATLSKTKFPDAERYQIGSVIGGFLYLRFFNPAIVAPDAINLIQIKPSRTCRRNLTLIAKVLQNLSNGVLFRDKEEYMKPMNTYIERTRDALQDYFDKLIAVDDLSDALQVDKYLEHTSVRMNTISISFNQIFLIHSLLLQHLDIVTNNKSDDPVRGILKLLGPSPPQVPKNDNRVVALQLQDRREQRLSTAVDAFAQPKTSSIVNQAKTLLLSILRLLPKQTQAENLEEFLKTERDKASSESDTNLADHITNVVSMLRSLLNFEGVFKKMPTPDETFNNFLWEIAMEIQDKNNKMGQLKKRLGMVGQALKAIQSHHEYLRQRLELYKQYLENVRKGSSQAPVADKKDDKKKKVQMLKFTHEKLEKDGVITKVDPSIPKAILKSCNYTFECVAPGQFEINVVVKKGFDVKVFQKPISLALEELLRMQEHGQQVFTLETVELNVNLLIHLLNTKFM